MDPRLIVPLLLAATALAGCTEGIPEEDRLSKSEMETIALSAVEDLRDAQRVSGDLESQSFWFELTSGDSIGIRLEGRADYHRGDVLFLEAEVAKVWGDDADGARDVLDDVAMWLHCTPDRYRVHIEGMDEAGVEDATRDVENPWGTCLDAVAADGMDAAWAQDLADELGMDDGSLFLAFSQGWSLPAGAEVTSVEQTGVERVEAVYRVQAAGVVAEVASTIVDGRIAAMHAESGGFGFDTRYGFGCVYGPRDADPGAPA